MNPEFWKGKKVLVTGCAGFKGTWLCLWLLQMGAKVVGYGKRSRTTPNMFSAINLEQRDGMTYYCGDILNSEFFNNVLRQEQPELVFHLAAQPIVRTSYEEPTDTFMSNTMGTVKILDSIRTCGHSVKAIINITTDKCYKDNKSRYGKRVGDRLGGFDPYSASKACAEIATSCFKDSYFSPKGIGIATARAGNVLGGGDWSEWRLVPACIRKAFESDEERAKDTDDPTRILNLPTPSATRPWQFVLDALFGYLTLAENVWFCPEKYSRPWNFGPDEIDLSVEQIIDKLSSKLKPDVRDTITIIRGKREIHETLHLALDPTEAKYLLNWHTLLNSDEMLDSLLKWYEVFYSPQKTIENLYEFSLGQIRTYNDKIALHKLQVRTKHKITKLLSATKSIPKSQALQQSSLIIKLENAKKLAPKLVKWIKSAQVDVFDRLCGSESFEPERIICGFVCNAIEQGTVAEYQTITHGKNIFVKHKDTIISHETGEIAIVLGLSGQRQTPGKDFLTIKELPYTIKIVLGHIKSFLSEEGLSMIRRIIDENIVVKVNSRKIELTNVAVQIATDQVTEKSSCKLVI
jgi:CDP-glucose 4,6-dehydratase